MKLSTIVGFISAVTACFAYDDEKGKEFAFSFIKPSKFNGIQTVLITAEERTDVTVDIPFESYTVTSTLQAGETWKFQISNSFWIETPFTASEKIVRIISDSDVAVYVTDIAPRTSSAYVALPLHALSESYIAVTYGPQSIISGAVNCYPTMLVISFRDDTNVNVRYQIQNGGTCGGLTTGETFSFSLMAYQVYGIECTDDFTGTLIESNRRIAVITGHGRANIYADHGNDIIQEMLLPVEHFGTEFVLFDQEARPMGTINRIVASMDNTEIITGDGQTLFLNAFDFIDIDTDNSGTMCITASNPVEVVSFGKGFFAGSTNGDDSMSIVPDVKMFTDKLFLNFDLSSIILDTDFVHIVLIYDRNDYSPGAVPSGDYLQSVPGCKYDLYTRLIQTWPFVMNAGMKVGAFLYGCYGIKNGVGFAVNMNFGKNTDSSSSAINSLTSQLNPTASMVQAEDVPLTSSYDNFLHESSPVMNDFQLFTDMNFGYVETIAVNSTESHSVPILASETHDFSQNTEIQISQDFSISNVSTAPVNQFSSVSSSSPNSISTISSESSTTSMSTKKSISTISTISTIQESPTSSPITQSSPEISSQTPSTQRTSSMHPSRASSSSLSPSSTTTLTSLTTESPITSTSTPIASTPPTSPQTTSSQTAISTLSASPSSTPTPLPQTTLIHSPITSISSPTTSLSSLISPSSTLFIPSSQPSWSTTSPEPSTSPTVTTSDPQIQRSRGLIIPGVEPNDRSICVCCVPKDIPEGLRHDLTKRIRNLLLLNKYLLSKSVRRRTCAKDERPSAQRLGYAGIISLVCVALVLILSDLTHKRRPNVIYINLRR